jgi:uncharacterized protein YjeT (DUF2065 family)
MGIKLLVTFTGFILVLSGIGLATLPFAWPNMLRLMSEAGGKEVTPEAFVVLPIGSGLFMVVIGSILLTITLIAARNKG